jgi:hypothetical protein
MVSNSGGYELHLQPDLLQTEIIRKTPLKQWSVATPTGTNLRPVNNFEEQHFSQLDIFLLIFPPQQLTTTVTNTN